MDMCSLYLIMVIKAILLIAFVMFIPISARCYFFSRHDQKRAEITRYLEILDIEERKRELFEHKRPGASLSAAVIFVIILSICGWLLVLFGCELNITKPINYLLGGPKILMLDLGDFEHIGAIQKYQNGALLTFNMAFLGAYLWGIQNIARRYTMNDLIPAAYYNIGVRMIFACILALVFYHFSEILPNIVTSMFTEEELVNVTATEKTATTHLAMPVIAFLIGLFPQRGLKWLTEKFSMFTQQKDPSVRDLPLEMIEGVAIYDRVRLQELGIDSCYDLANADYIPYLFKSPYSPRELINWILQAKLCVYFGEHVKSLREHGVHTVWHLNDYDESALKNLAKSTSLTEDTLLAVKSQISKDQEIKRLIDAQLELSRYWDKNKKTDKTKSK